MITCLHQNKNLTVVVWQDSADGIANELLTAGLIVGDDLVSMAANLDRLITQPPPSKQLCFKISSGIATHESPDEKALLGTDLFITAVSTNSGSRFYLCPTSLTVLNCRFCSVDYSGLVESDIWAVVFYLLLLHAVQT